MNARIAKWAVALLLSAVLHAGAAIWFSTDQNAVEIAGGTTAEIAVLGSAFQDSMAAGQVTDAVEPVEEEIEPVEPVEDQPSEAVEADETAQPLETPPETTIQQKPVVPAEQAESAEPVTPQFAQPVEVIENGIAIAALQPQDVISETEDAVAPTESVESVSEEAAIAGVQPQDTATRAKAAIAPSETPAIEPVEEEFAQTPAAAPRPTPRPEKIAKAEPPRNAEPKPREKAEKKSVEKPRQKKRERAGVGGQNKQNARKGTADGSKDARQAQSGGAGRSRESGNATVSNYPGKIASKLRRSLRYPSEARRKRIRGEVHVRFTVSRSGGVGSVGIARSSGSPVLDKAAVETVRRAAPFPAIPAEAGRSSWSFTVPLAFRR